jgi:diguanylate cyclase (GGDEF)-like protein/PAS domain S-box-containing protein
MNLSVQKKLIILFCLGLTCLAGIGFLLASDSALSGPGARLRTTEYTPLEAINNLRTIVTTLETAELDYALSGESRALTAFRSAAATLHRPIGDLRMFFTKEKALLAELARLEPLTDERIKFGEKVVAARKRGGSKTADTLVRSGNGRQLSKQISASLASLEQEWLKSSAGQAGLPPHRPRKETWLLIAGYTIALAIMLITVVIIRREFRHQRRLGEAVHELRDRLRLFTDGFKDSALFVLGPDGTIVHWNAAAEHLHGFQPRDVMGKHFAFLFPEKDIPLGKPEHCLNQAAETGHCEHVGWRLRKDGSLFLAHTIITPGREQDGGLREFSVVTRDITTQRQTEDLLKKLALTVEQAADLVIITDRSGKVEFVNKAAEEVTGFTREELLAGGMDLLQTREQNELQHQKLWDTVLAGNMFQAEVAGISKNGELIHLDEVVTPIKDEDGKVSHVVFTGTDITAIKLMRSKLDFLASYDALTGLPNRDLFADRLNRDMTVLKPGGGLIAVLAFDIDRFKYINEIYGLEAGNNILKQVAESLSVSVNKSDTVGRMGSDEFGIALHDVKRPADVVLFAKMIMKNVPQIIMSGGEEISVTLSTGIAVYPTDGQDANALMKNADTALSKAKTLGRNRYQFYTPEMNVGISELVFMEQQLSDALKNREYMVSFQPYCYLSTRKVAGSEALLKWNNDEFGQVSPSKFIPMLEETGMIIDVGKWVLTTACKQIKAWTNGVPPLPVSVNLSPNQFRHEYLVETVESAIRDSGIDPRRLTLEVTESTFMKDQGFAITVLKRLKELGVAIAIDDFGTGYSSLSYLKQFPVDYIKIDQSFVKDVATDPDTTALVTAIITMAHSLNLKTIAEGIETEEQWKILRLLKCDMGQGFYFSPAITPSEFEKMIT